MNTIPTDTTGVPYYSEIVTLTGVTYVLEFRYNFREECWYVQMGSTSGDVFAQGIKIVSNFPLLQRFSSASMPPGELVSLSSSNDDSPATLYELGDRCSLLYFEKGELPGNFDGNR